MLPLTLTDDESHAAHKGNDLQVVRVNAQARVPNIPSEGRVAQMPAITFPGVIAHGSQPQFYYSKSSTELLIFASRSGLSYVFIIFV